MIEYGEFCHAFYNRRKAMKEWKRTHRDALQDIVGRVTQPFTDQRGYDQHGRRTTRK